MNVAAEGSLISERKLGRKAIRLRHQENARALSNADAGTEDEGEV